MLFVSPESAAGGRSWEVGDEYRISLPEDHFGIVKFAENDHSSYELVQDVLRDFVAKAEGVIKARMEKETNQCKLFMFV